jgi:hypothetical protein
MEREFCFRRAALQTGRQDGGRGRLRRDEKEGVLQGLKAHRSRDRYGGTEVPPFRMTQAGDAINVFGRRGRRRYP